MRVLHIVVAGTDGAGDTVAAAESLIASMAAADPAVEVAELVLGGHAVAGVGGAEHGPHDVQTSTAALIAELVSADLFVLTLPSSRQDRDELRWLVGVLRGPQIRLARAWDRRGGHRVRRRLVVVAGRDAAHAHQRGALLALVRDAFRAVDVTEAGVITGEAVGTARGVPPGGSRRSSARSWIGHRDPREQRAAS